MNLYYDRISKMYSTSDGKQTEFLGPITNTMLLLQSNYGLSELQAREATLTATMNGGLPVSLSQIKGFASKESHYFKFNKQP